MIAAIERSIEAQKKDWAYCPKCKSKVQVDRGHDIKGILDAAKWLTDRGIGTPSKAPDPVKPPDETTPLELLTDEELRALAGR